MLGNSNNKNRLKLGFTDTFQGTVDYFTKVLSKNYDIVRDDENPDYLIFGDRNFGQNNLRYTKCIKIFYTGENQRPEDYQCHYSISFDHTDDETHFRLPLYVLYENDHQLINRHIRHKDDTFLVKGFCSFVQKNPGCDKRNSFFHALNNYKNVAAAGPLFNNMPDQWRPSSSHEKVKFMSQFKFNLCFENSSYPGYCTEKLFESLSAKTVPIYWGSPTAAIDFNPKAFINWHDYNNDDDFFDAIIKLDRNDDAYAEMYFQPMFTDGLPNRYFDDERLIKWFHRNVYKGELNV